MDMDEGACRVLVLQNGARHDYAVPLAFEKAGMLAGFYTDICGNEGLGRWLSEGVNMPVIGKSLRRLQNRVVPEAVLSKTRSFPLATVADQAWTRFAGHKSTFPVLGAAMKTAGFCGANVIYASLGWSPGFLRHARSKGVKVVTEFYVRPSHWRIHQEEYLKYPGWEEAMPHGYFNESPEARRGACDVSDYIIAPAPAVKEDLIRTCGFAEERIRVVPYGIKPAFFAATNQANPGLVLFVGSCTIAKGIHCLAEASLRVPDRIGDTTVAFKAAGGVTDMVRLRPECRKIQFLGRVPRHDIARLYSEADVLVFPTLSDSFGMVMLEAMAAGVPVISSPHCADIVQHGVNGLVVEPHDIGGLAEAIKSVITDRHLRNRMAAAARERASEYLWDLQLQNLAETVRDMTTATATASLIP